MSMPAQKPPVCWSCQTNEATAVYRIAERETLLCFNCYEELSTRDALETKVRELWDLQDNGRFDEALASLDAFFQTHRHRDHGRWLSRAVQKERARILIRAERYPEAESACATWAQLGISSIAERLAHGREVAEILEATGRPREALNVIEEACGYLDSRFNLIVPHWLAELAKLCELVGQPMNEKWRPLAEGSAREHGIEMPVRESFTKTILALHEKVLEKQRGPEDKCPFD